MVGQMFEKLTNMELMFLGCAIVGGGLFLLRSIMLLTGLGGDDGEAVEVSESSGEPIADFKLVTVHGLTAFLMMFGLVGFLMLRKDGQAPRIAVIAATVAGLVTMFIIAKIFHASRKLHSDGTIYPQDAVGLNGSIYLTIRPGGIGKVQVTVRDALKVFDARATDAAAEIKTGASVKVVEAKDVLIVEPA